MRILPVSEVHVSDTRQRRTFNPETLVELASDIALNGLMHAPVVRYEGNQAILVAGERRMRALSILSDMGMPFRFDGRVVDADHVPTITLGELDELAAEEAELSENIHREDLTWQERAEAEARFHTLRARQATARGETQTIESTAKELGSDSPSGRERVNLGKRLLVAQALHIPEVAKAKSLDEAYKVLERAAEIEHRTKLAETLSQTQPRTRHTLIQGDCRQALQGYDNYDVLCTDPPYGVGADQFGEQGSQDRQYSDDPKLWLDLMIEALDSSTQIMKPKAHSYIFCAFERFWELRDIMTALGWFVWPRPIIWPKGAGVAPVPDKGPRYTYECILFARRGDRPVLVLEGDVLPQFTSTNKHGHPDEKPVEVYVNLLRRSAYPGDLVVDPFAGSGTVFAAANILQLTALGVEQNPAMYTIAHERMETKE